MGIRKLTAVAVMAGAVSAAGLGLAGTASATTPSWPTPGNTTNNNCSYGNNCNKLYTKVSAQKTVVKDSNVTGVAINQNASNTSNVTNNQNGVAVALPVNAQAQVPVNANGGTGFSKFSSSKADQDATQKQYNGADATANKSYISTSTNTISKGVANGTSVNIGGSAQNGDNSSNSPY